MSEIGAFKLKKLNATQVDDWLEGLADELSTATLHKLHSALSVPSGRLRRGTWSAAMSPNW